MTSPSTVNSETAVTPILSGRGLAVRSVALSESLDKPLEWAVGFFFGDAELSLELWTVIAGISGFDDWGEI